MKVALFIKIADGLASLWERLTAKNPPSKQKLITTAIIALLAYLLTMCSDTTLNDLEQLTDFSISTYQKLED